jgi:hypothetical protein
MLKMFVGDNGEYLANYANQYGNSILVTAKNYKKIIEQSKTQNIVAHFSFSDIGKITKNDSPCYTLLMSADEIEYVPPVGHWSDHSDQFTLHSMQRITEYYLYDVNRLKNNVKGLNLDHWTKDSKYLNLSDQRNNTRNLWITGCSISHGIGVDKNQRYGKLLADEINLSVSFLTMAGSSIEWAADQILRSDIRSDDIVVWGLTSEYRATECKNNKVKHINTHSFEASESGSLAIVSAENRLYKALIAVNQVENFCCKIGAKLILFPLISSESLRLHLSSNLCYYENAYQPNFIDLGSDQLHPGPQQHKAWANKLKTIITSGNLNERTLD